MLMLSGIGNADALKSLGISVIQHLPGVGENLQDHIEAYVQYACSSRSRFTARRTRSPS